MIKKRISLGLIAMIILCMSGCSAQKSEQPDMLQEFIKEQETEASKGDEENEEMKPSSEVESEEINESEAADNNQDEQKVTDSGYLDVTFEHHWDGLYEDVSLMNARYNSINLHTTDYPALTEAVNTFNAGYIERTQGYIDQIKGDAASMYQESLQEDGYWLGPFEYRSEMFLKRADKKVLSVEEQIYSFEGGVHGLNYYYAYNFDVPSGELITLDSVITDMSRLPEVLVKEITDKYPDLGSWDENFWDGFFDEYITPSQEDYRPEFTWTLGYDGVTFYFSNYEIGSYADGLQQVTICYSEYPEILSSSYFADVENTYVTELDDLWSGKDTDLNHDKVTDYISVTHNYDYEMDFIASYNVTVNGNTFTQDSYCYEQRSFLVKAGEKNYIYVERTVENDYRLIDVFEITECSVEYMGGIDGGLGSFSNSLNFEVEKRMDLLSTYTAVAECYVGEDGLPAEHNAVYEVKSDISITSVVRIEAELLNEKGELTGESNTFPEGTEFKFMVTDGNTFVDMLASDGQKCRIYVEKDESAWTTTINGKNVEECFEMLYYAG